MRIFNIENGTEKVYLQVKDILLLKNYEFEKPEFIDRLVISEDLDENDFVEFNKQEEVSFFRSLDWFVDFREVRYLPHKSILALEQNDVASKSELNKLLLFTSKEELEKRNKMTEMLDIVDNRLKDYESILEFKNGKNRIPFPLVPDYDGFKWLTNDIYMMSPGLNPYITLLSRKDSKPLSDEDKVPLELEARGLDASFEELDNNDLLGTSIDVKRYVTGDKRYIVTEVSCQGVKEAIDKKTIHETVSSSRETRGLRKIFSGFFGRKKQAG